LVKIGENRRDSKVEARGVGLCRSFLAHALLLFSEGLVLVHRSGAHIPLFLSRWGRNLCNPSLRQSHPSQLFGAPVGKNWNSLPCLLDVLLLPSLTKMTEVLRTGSHFGEFQLEHLSPYLGT